MRKFRFSLRLLAVCFTVRCRFSPNEGTQVAGAHFPTSFLDVHSHDDVFDALKQAW